VTAANILLILISAVLHVVSHVAMKRARNRAAFIWLMWLWAVVLYIPVAYQQWQPIPWQVCGIMLVSAIVDACYYIAIARAYLTGDLSIVYPLSRGSAPLFILVWSTLLLRETRSSGGLLGIGIIVLGLCALNLPGISRWGEALRALNQPAARWALAGGFFTSIYTTLDRVGVGYLPPLFYTYLTMSLMAAFLLPIALRSAGWRGILDEWRTSKWQAAVAGFFAMSAYATVLYAMHGGLPTSYAGATREISVVFSAVIGIWWLKEPGSFMRFLGSAMIAAGVATIALIG
jgi:drug/metabolite transporter (DMT)-like permease